jgi:phosphate:Na+ symporter
VSGHSVLLNILGGVALLIWATRFVRTGVLRAFGEGFRSLLGRATASSARAFTTGIAVSAAVQSSSATALLTASFVERGLLALTPALAVMLGADVGSTLVVQALSLNLAGLIPVLLVSGVAAFMLGTSARIRQSGRIAIGLALMMLSLGLIVSASQPLRASPTITLVLQRLAEDPILALLIGAALAWLLHSSVALILLVVTLVDGGVVAVEPALALVLGANVGSGLIPLGMSLKAPAAARRVVVGNLAFRMIGALLALPWLGPAAQALVTLETAAGRQIANGHTAFNLTLGLLALPFCAGLALLLQRHLPDRPEPAGDMGGEHLDDALLDRPALALGAASREVMRLAGMVETMLREALLPFGPGGEERRQALKALDVPVDRLQEQIKLYLTRLTRHPLTEQESRQAFDLILFTTNLEHVGDIIDKNLLELAAKKQRLHLAFSTEGWHEIETLHRRVVDQMRLAITLFLTRDPAMARALVAEKDRLRQAERTAMESHLGRLRDGKAASIETSALHLDILRDLKRINAHLTAVAYPILEANGELSGSRLRTAAE